MAADRLIKAAPALLACVEGFVAAFGNEVEHDLPINGADAVNWISGAMLEFRVALAQAAPRAIPPKKKGGR